MSKIFEFNDYKSFLKKQIAQKRGEHTNLARIAQCQKAYLSRVLKGEAHLTPDHAFRMTEYWKMTNDERDYFLNLLEIERAADPSFKKMLMGKSKFLRSKNLQLKSVTDREEAPFSQHDLFYHSHWAILAIHVLAASPKYRRVDLLQKKLELPQPVFEYYLNYLLKQNLIARSGNELKVESGPKHLSKDSPSLSYFLNLWRQRAIMHLPFLDEESIHFTNVQTISLRDYERLVHLLRNFISEISVISNSSNDDEAYIFNCDLFRI